ncbi:hypothetical protein ACFYTQ_24235 [Nocardia sp. NPDC004068]|uniref:hypothetical protein n=1 Tax=Nocardia sp. NPDC004068 TaxID=3364303 RepID=UPI0036A8152C
MAPVLVVGAVLSCGHGPITVKSNAILTVAGQPVLLADDARSQAAFKCSLSTPCTAFGPFEGLSTVLTVRGQRVLLTTTTAKTLPNGSLIITAPGQTVLVAK